MRFVLASGWRPSHLHPLLRLVCVRLLLTSVRDDEVVEFVESVFDEVEELEVEFRERAKQSECLLRVWLLQRVDRLVFARDFLASDGCESVQKQGTCTRTSSHVQLVTQLMCRSYPGTL